MYLARRAEGRCHGGLCALVCVCVYFCALTTAWLLFMAVWQAQGQPQARATGAVCGYSPGEAFPPAAYQDNGTQCQK